MAKSPKYDEIGYWSEIKLDIVRDYARAYSKIISAQKHPSLQHVYIDAFAGGGFHISRTTRHFVKGSPLNALVVRPPFSQYHFIDLKRDKTESLRKIVGDQENVHIYEGDCNRILLYRIFGQVRYDQFRRGLCLLDPYGLHLNWEVIQTAGKMKSMEIFLNFPLADMNRNVLWRDPERVDSRQVARMNAFWGDESWRDVAYESQPTLFGDVDQKTSTRAVVQGFHKRLIEVAGFKYVPEPLPMRNTQNAIVYYLFFASQNQAGKKIVGDIFEKHSRRSPP